MQLPNPNASSEVYLDHTNHFEGAAEAWADAEIITADQAKAIAAALAIASGAADKLRAAAGATDAATRAATKARARYNVRDAILDMRVMTVSDALLNGLCGRNHAHPVYKHVFQGSTAGAITEAKIREEPEIAEQMLSRYQATEDFPGKAAAGDLLAVALKKSLQGRDAVEDAEKAENKAGDEELLARLGVRNGLEQAYGMLRTAFPGQRRFVESFFLKRERADARADDKGKSPAPPPAPPTP